MSIRRVLSLFALMAVAIACSDDPTAPPGTSFVSLRFQSAPAPSAAITGGSASMALIEGTNGAIDLTSVQVIVAEFELEGEDDSCELGDSTMCSEFESGPFFMDLPLDGAAVALGTEAVPNGTYEELDFEIEDLEDDGEEDEAAAVALLQEVQAQYSDWPEAASMRAAGTFTPTGGSAVPFVVYFDAEIEIEMVFAAPLVLSDDRSGVNLTVQLDPDAWFTLGDGSVLDLSQFDYPTTTQLLNFEVEIENGFREIEVDLN